MDTLHRHNYDLSSALSVLVPAGGPVLCRDEMEEWSASEAAMFEEALEKYGKDFNDIRQDFVSLPKCLLDRERHFRQWGLKHHIFYFLSFNFILNVFLWVNTPHSMCGFKCSM